MADPREPPKGRIGRLARLASVGARSGARMLLNRDADDAAKHAAEVLGNLRGLATKVGQMASYIDGVVPEGQRDSYEHWLGKLQSAAHHSTPEAIRGQVVAELGRPVDELFAEWDDAPLASASIGQVHRARLHDGRPVAVKVQHPGVAEAVEADLRNAGLLEAALAAVAGTRRFESKRVLEEIRERFREELDYTLEAERQRRFTALFAGDDQVVIPEVIDDHCTQRVLTTTFVEGLSLDAARARPEAERAVWCETLWHFVYKASLVGKLFNADPHPGNYFFQPDGRVAFLDYGCVQPVDPGRSVHACDLHRASHRGDLAAFREAGKRMLDLQGGPYETRALEYVELCFAPLFESPYRMSRDYVSTLVAEMKRLALDFRKGKDDGYVPLPPGVFFLNRLQFGFYSVLARLDAPADYRTVEQRFLGDA